MNTAPRNGSIARWPIWVLNAFALIFPLLTGPRAFDSNDTKFYGLAAFTLPLAVLLLKKQVSSGVTTRRGTRLTLLITALLGVYGAALAGFRLESVLILFLLPTIGVLLGQAWSPVSVRRAGPMHLFTGLFTVAVAACYFTRFQFTALMGAEYRHTGLVTFLCVAILLLAAREFVCEERDQARLLTCLLAGSVPVCIVALWQFFAPEIWMKAIFYTLDGEPRPMGTMGHTNWLGTYLVLLLPLALGRALRHKNPIWLLVSGLMYAAILVAQTRGAWLGTLVVILVTLWYGRREAFAVGRLLVMLMVLSGFLGTWDNSRILNRAASLGDEANQALNLKPGAGTGRFYFWKYGLSHLPRYTVLGAGFDTFGEHGTAAAPAPTSKAHSIYLEYALTLGIPGLAMYLLFVWLSFRKSRFDGLPWVGTTMVIGYLVQGFFIHDTIQSWPVLWLLAGVALAEQESAKSGRSTVNKT